MLFTESDYKKILSWLQKNSIKDTELLYAAEPFAGKEIITLVQNGLNVKTTLSSFIAQLIQLGSPDVINITALYDKRNIGIEEAIELVPYRSRKVGLILTFINDEGKWKVYLFQSDNTAQWFVTSVWVDLIKEIENLGFSPDEEHLTIQDNILRLKDKEYNESKYSGMGRIYVRKNVVTALNSVTGVYEEKNILLDWIFSQENTIYIIEYDFDLNHQYIQIPDNCILSILGGHLRNGTIICNNTIIDSLTPVECQLEGNYRYSISVSGTTSNRPEPNSIQIGFCYFDTDLCKPIWNCGTKWVDATGEEV